MSYNNIKNFLSDSDAEIFWNNTSLTPWILESNDNIYQIHYENPQSVSYKVQVIKDAHLGGLAIWAIIQVILRSKGQPPTP